MQTSIRELTLAILADNEPGILYNHIHQLHDIYAALTGISATHIPNEAIYLSTGKAIGPVGAAHCLLEIQRTAKFLRGIYKAIIYQKLAFPGKRINILYAGCGPYATLLTPMATLFPETDIGFILLDINEVSLSASKHMFQQLGLSNHVIKYVLADATDYKIAASDDITMVISETMLNALRREPQVAVMQNLVPQMQNGSMFIPYSISVSARLTSSREERALYMSLSAKANRIHLGELCNLSHEDVVPQATSFNIPADTGSLDQLQLFTDITVFEDEKLQNYDCSLTLPITLFEITDTHKGKQITFRYVMGSNPRFEWKLSDGETFRPCDQYAFSRNTTTLQAGR